MIVFFALKGSNLFDYYSPSLSTWIYKGVRSKFSFVFFFDKIRISKQNNVLRRHIWGYSVCLYPIKRTPGLYGLSNIKTKQTKHHYANMSVQYTAIFHGCKNNNFQMKNCDVFLIFAQNIDCGYTLEPPQ